MTSCYKQGKGTEALQKFYHLLMCFLQPTVFPFLVSCVGQGKVDDQLLQGTKTFLAHLDKELKGKHTLCGVSHEEQKKWI